MSDDTAALAPPAPPPPTSTSTATPRRRLRPRLRLPKPDITIAVVSWLVGTPIALLIVHTANVDPFSARGGIMPLAVGSVVAGCLIVLYLLTRSELVVGLGVGAFASWVALTIAAALHG